MARFGQGINPQLLTVDYSPIMQGTQVAAQGIAQGGAAIGNALAQLGQQAGAAVQGYYKKKEENEFLDSSQKAVSSFLSENPDFAKQIGVRDPNDPKLVKTLFKELGGGNPMQGAQAVRSAMMQYQAMEPQRQEQKAVGVAMAAINSGKMDPLAAVQSMGMQITPGVANFVAQYQNTQAQTQNLLSEAAARMQPKAPDLSFQEQAVQAAVADFTAQTGRPPQRGELYQIYQDVARMNKAETNINMPGSQSKYAETLGVEGAKQDLQEFNAAKQSSTNIPKILDTIKLIKEGKAETGKFSGVITELNRIKSKYMNDLAAAKSVEDTQVLNAQMGQRVFEAIQSLGIGARGLDTPAEREFLREVMSGTTELNAGSLVRLAEMSLAKEIGTVERFNERVRSGELENFFKESKRTKREFEVPYDLIKPQAPEEQLAVPEGVDPKLWEYMAPEQRRLWK